MELFDLFPPAAADPRRRGAGRFHRRAIRLPRAEGHLRVFPRPRRALRQGPVRGGRISRSRRAVALAAYPLGLAMVGEMVEGVLRPQAGDDRRAVLDRAARARALGLRPLSGPAALGEDAWQRARARACAPARADRHCIRPSAPSTFRSHSPRRYFDMMPIHEKLRGAGLPDHPQLSAGHSVQYPRRIDQAHGRGRDGCSMLQTCARSQLVIGRAPASEGAMAARQQRHPAARARRRRDRHRDHRPRSAQGADRRDRGGAARRPAGSTATASFRRLIRPGEPIPAAATASTASTTPRSPTRRRSRRCGRSFRHSRRRAS